MGSSNAIVFTSVEGSTSNVNVVISSKVIEVMVITNTADESEPKPSFGVLLRESRPTDLSTNC